MSLKCFQGDPAREPNQRIDAFIQWGQPQGTAGINSIHSNIYKPEDPWFEYAPRLTPHGHGVARSWFLKYEYRSCGSEAYKRSRLNREIEINNRLLLISEGQYLSFAKAYINVISYYSSYRSFNKSVVHALLILEYSIRMINNGDNSPELISYRTFEMAQRTLQESEYSQGVKYDVGKELERMAGMLCCGYHSKSFRFRKMGFRLLRRNIVFKSNIQMRARKKLSSRNVENMKEGDSSRISNEELASFGLCYHKAIVEYGKNSVFALFSSIIGLSLISVSMRVSELINLKRDSLYPDNESDVCRCRIRLERAKIGQHQDVPVPLKLSQLINDQFNIIKEYTKEAHRAFSFYVDNFGDSFSSINKLYIPNKYEEFFNKEYLTRNDVNKILEMSESADRRVMFPQRIRSISVHFFVDEPGDSIVDTTNHITSSRFIRISDFISLCTRNGIDVSIPDILDKSKYMRVTKAIKYAGACKQKINRIIEDMPSVCRTISYFIKSKDLYDYLLSEFKKKKFPHWPYLTKEKSTKIDSALLVWFAPSTCPTTSDTEKGKWWLPTPISASTIYTWINEYNGQPGILFEKLGIKLHDGNYPSITLHQARKYHQTSALLAGANEAFIDKLAGRQTGRQSDHYDLRTPHEIVSQSIELFDPDSDFDVIGPVANDAPDPSNVIERKVFLYEHAAPKQITEVGGCRSDWSLNPCEQYGDCMRCDKSIWRKGDQKRLPFIKELHGHALNMITLAEDKIKCGNDLTSIRKHLQQNRETLIRCEAILAAEDNPSIKVGTIVTFDAPDTAFSTSQLTQRLHDQHCCKDSE